MQQRKNFNFGENLRNILIERSLTQKAFALKMNVGYSTLNAWVRNVAFPPLDDIILICNTLECGLSDLLGIEDEEGQHISEKEKRILTEFRMLSKEKQHDLLTIIEILKK